MSEADERPQLYFFRTMPDLFMSRPPLCSSLQNLESCFFMIALGRFPHALVTCASSVESAMKSVLNVPPEQFMNAEKLFAQAASAYPALRTFDSGALDTFRFTRNRIVHYGFSPRDDEETATLLLKIGLPFLSACYREFFIFDLLNGLVVEFGEQLRIALEVYQRTQDIPDIRYSFCFSAFAHLIRWSVRQSLMADWENDASVRADEIGAKFESCERKKNALERVFGAAWFFDCPICHDIGTFVCELDKDRLDDRAVVLKRVACASCGLIVRNIPFLPDILVGDQVARKHTEILREFGITDV
jgi:hypothetical protein